MRLAGLHPCITVELWMFSDLEAYLTRIGELRTRNTLFAAGGCRRPGAGPRKDMTRYQGLVRR